MKRQKKQKWLENMGYFTFISNKFDWLQVYIQILHFDYLIKI